MRSGRIDDRAARPAEYDGTRATGTIHGLRHPPETVHSIVSRIFAEPVTCPDSVRDGDTGDVVSAGGLCGAAAGATPARGMNRTDTCCRWNTRPGARSRTTVRRPRPPSRTAARQHPRARGGTGDAGLRRCRRRKVHSSGPVAGSRQEVGCGRLDRLWHRSRIVNIRGNSYRMRRQMELSRAIHPTAPRAVDAEDARRREKLREGAGTGRKCAILRGRNPDTPGGH